MDLDLLPDLYRDHVAELQRRYEPILAELGLDAVVLHSGSLKKRSEFDDQDWPLRPTPHFQHWLPLKEADCALIVAPGKKPKLLWRKTQSYWERPAEPELRYFDACLDIEELPQIDDLRPHVPPGRIGFVGDEPALGVRWGLGADRYNYAHLIGRLDRLRVHKTPYEVACLAEANRLAAAGHEALRAAFRTGDLPELTLHLRYLEATRQDDSETPYKNIVALGHNAATLHHIHYGKRAAPKDVQSLLVDAGATFQGYASDITRTWLRGTGATASAFGHLVAGVEAMQLRLCAAAKVDLPYEELHEEAHRQVIDILRDVGIVRQPLEPDAARVVSRAFFPHGLGHSLGLQCHDVGCALVKPRLDNPYLRNTSIIAPGQVFTIEPGIYFVDFLMDQLRQGPQRSSIDWSLVTALAELGGVRIEDDLHITADAGPENLTRPWLPVGGGI